MGLLTGFCTSQAGSLPWLPNCYLILDPFCKTCYHPAYDLFCLIPDFTFWFAKGGSPQRVTNRPVNVCLSCLEKLPAFASVLLGLRQVQKTSSPFSLHSLSPHPLNSRVPCRGAQEGWPPGGLEEGSPVLLQFGHYLLTETQLGGRARAHSPAEVL